MGFVRDLTGKTAAGAATKAGEIQQASAIEQAGEVGLARDRAISLLDPFAAATQAGVEQAGFLTDPNAQFDFVQNNPLFKLALENANRQTNQIAAAGGRLSAGDTLQDLSSNVLLQASPLIQQQKQSISQLLGAGTGIAQNQANIDMGGTSDIANLITGGASAQAAGKVGAANARTAGAQGLGQLALTGAFLASDERLKTNINKTGVKGGHNWYTWTWNDLAKKVFGLTGDSEGVIAQEAIKITPDAVILDPSGYYKVNYGAL